MTKKDLPVAASMIRRMVVIKQKAKTAVDRTVLVGHLRTKGAMRMAPMH